MLTSVNNDRRSFSATSYRPTVSPGVTPAMAAAIASCDSRAAIECLSIVLALQLLLLPPLPLFLPPKFFLLLSLGELKAPRSTFDHLRELDLASNIPPTMITIFLVPSFCFRSDPPKRVNVIAKTD